MDQRYLLLALVLAIAPACAATREGEAQPAPTEICVLGMIHSDHLTSETWGLADVEATLRALAPDAVLCEIPPDRYPLAEAEFAENRTIEEPRVTRFPEYTGVLFPLETELGYAIVPCAAWTRPMADDRAAKLDLWRSTRPDDTAAVDAGFALIDERHKALGGANDPRVIHTDAYDEVVRAGMHAYDERFGSDLGLGGWTNINAAHWALVEAAIEARPGQRLVITFGAWHKYWFLDRLRELKDVVLLDAHEYLPAPRPPTK